MLVVMTQGPGVRVGRDGPSPAEQAQQAAAEQLRAEIAATSARMQEIVSSGAARTTAGRMELERARDELLSTAEKLRELESQRREQAIEDAAQGLAARAIAQGTTVQPPRMHLEPQVPPEAVDISIAFFVCTAAAIVLFPLMRSLGRILERRATPPARLAPSVEAQLQRMEQAIETVAVEVERISEGQRFTAKLLADRDKATELRA